MKLILQLLKMVRIVARICNHEPYANKSANLVCLIPQYHVASHMHDHDNDENLFINQSGNQLIWMRWLFVKIFIDINDVCHRLLI